MQFLADDNLEGRETGSEGLRKAQAYVVDQFKKAGLEPAGTNGFYQPIKFVSRQIVESESSAALISGGKAQPLVLGDDAYFSTRANLSPDAITAKLVFVGYGLKIPEQNYDDLAGLDLKGKIVVYIAGSPADTPTALSRPLSNRAGALEIAESRRRHRHHRDSQSRIDGHSVVAHRIQPHAPVDGSRRQGIRRNRRPQTVIDLQSRECGKTFRRLGPHFRRTRRAGKDRQNTAKIPSKGLAESSRDDENEGR